MDAEKKRLRDEVADLGEAVRALRDELAQERVARTMHSFHCCHCGHTCVWPNFPGVVYPNTWQQPVQIWCGDPVPASYTVTTTNLGTTSALY